MVWDSIIASRPVDRKSAIVTSQRNVSDTLLIGRQELIELKERLVRKQKLLKQVLKITTLSQHRNLVMRVNRGKGTKRGKENPRAVIEYVNLGRQIQNLNEEISKIRRKT